MTARTALRPASVLLSLLFALSLALAFSLSATALAQEEEEEGDPDPGQLIPGDDEEDGAEEEDGFEEDGFEDDGFEDEAPTEAFGDEDPQVDAPVGGAEAGFGGLADDGNGLLMLLFAGSMATVAAVAGTVWYRKAYLS